MYFIWQLINIFITGLIIFFGVKFIINFKKHKLKTISYTVVTFTLLLISNIIREENNEIVLLESQSEKALTESTTINNSTNLIETFLFNLNVETFFLDDSNEIIPKKVVSKLKGFSYGFDWHLKNAEIIKNDDSTYNYILLGNLDWNLFGLSFYTQEKEFVGTLIVKE